MLLSLFASPYEGDFVALADSLSGRNFRKVLAKANAQAERLGQEPIAIPSSAADPRPFSARWWAPELGAAEMGLNRHVTQATWPWLAAQMKIAAFLAGALPSVDLEFAGSHPLVVAGHFLQSERFAARGQENELRIEDGQGQALLSLRKFEQETAPVWAKSREDLVRVGAAGHAVLSDNTWMRYWHPTWERSDLSCQPRQDKGFFEDTLGWMQKAIPLHFLWVRLVLRELVMLRPFKSGSQSQSFTMWPGHIHGSVSSLVTNVVLLVHECTHQYFYLALWNARAVKADAPEVYSALKKKVRPLEKVLLGFHALGNVMLALQALEPSISDAHRGELMALMRDNRQLSQSMDASLQEKAVWLEPAGAALYFPLRQRLLENGILGSA